MLHAVSVPVHVVVPVDHRQPFCAAQSLEFVSEVQGVSVPAHGAAAVHVQLYSVAQVVCVGCAEQGACVPVHVDVPDQLHPSSALQGVGIVWVAQVTAVPAHVPPTPLSLGVYAHPAARQ